MSQDINQKLNLSLEKQIIKNFKKDMRIVS